MGELTIVLATELRFFLASDRRGAAVRARCDGTSSLGHVVESLGVPLPEVGRVVVNGEPATPAYRPAPADRVEVAAVARPQPLPSAGFLLDVHLGTLARHLRLVGIDTAYPGDRTDDALIEQANAERRMVLTQDRAMLCRRKLWCGGYVRGTRPRQQLRDVMDRFAPPLAPWTRCPACNGPLLPVDKHDIEHLLKPGTRRTYDAFSRCTECGRVYWRGAHGERLQHIVDEAFQARDRRVM